MNDTADIFFLLITFQVKHFLADYPLQTTYMLGKFLPDWRFLRPLLRHCSVHAGLTFLIFSVYGFSSIPLGLIFITSLIDFCFHFVMDRLKAGPRYLGRFKALSASEYSSADSLKKRDNTYFWWSLGLDQMVHHLTDLLNIYLIVKIDFL